MAKIDQIWKSSKSVKSASIHRGLLINFMTGNKTCFYHFSYLVEVFYDIEKQTLKKNIDL